MCGAGVFTWVHILPEKNHDFSKIAIFPQSSKIIGVLWTTLYLFLKNGNGNVFFLIKILPKKSPDFFFIFCYCCSPNSSLI